MDIALVCKNADVDWSWVSSELSEVGLFDFANTVCKMNERWFGVKSPLNGKSIDDGFFEKVTEKIFRDGIFGHDNEENERTAGIVRMTRNSGKHIGKARIKYLLEQSFPDYHTLCRLPYCAYVKKSKILIPIAWIHRCIYRMANTGFRQAFWRRTMASSKKIDERLEMMNEWGL